MYQDQKVSGGKKERKKQSADLASFVVRDYQHDGGGTPQCQHIPFYQKGCRGKQPSSQNHIADSAADDEDAGSCAYSDAGAGAWHVVEEAMQMETNQGA